VSVSTPRVSWTEHPEYILNKAKARSQYDHVVGEGVIAYNVSNVDVSKCDNAASNVSKSAASKNVEQKVSEVTQDDVQLKLGIGQMMEFMKTSETFKTGKQAPAEQQKQKEQKKQKTDNFSDVEPDDPVSVDTDENANVVATEKSEKSKISVNEPDFESVIAETVVISSDTEIEGNDKRQWLCAELAQHPIGAELPASHCRRYA